MHGRASPLAPNVPQLPPVIGAGPTLHQGRLCCPTYSLTTDLSGRIGKRHDRRGDVTF